MEISELADQYWAYRLATDHLTSLWKGDLTHLDDWDDLTPGARRSDLDRLEAFARRAGEARSTDPREIATLDTIAFTARSRAIQFTHREELAWVNPAIGFHSLLLTFLPRYPLVTADHGERYLTKIDRLPRLLSDWGTRLTHAAAARITPIEHLVRGVVAAIDRQLAADPDPLTRQPAPTEVDGPSAVRFREALEKAVASKVRPALAHLSQTLLDKTLPAARADNRPGLCYIDGGSADYERLVWAHTSVDDLTATQVHAIGLEQVARLEDDYRQIAGPLLGTTDVAEIYQRLRDDPELHYQDAVTLVADATTALAKAEAAMGGWFGRLPQSPCLATSIEQGALAFYSVPARDGSKPGTFFFNTSDPTVWGTFQLEAVTYHEGIPGHHLQLALALEDPSLHDVHKELYIAAYNEGWGLYTERLSDEMGLYSSELDRVGMLSGDSMRACRLVVDTGMHALGWGRDKAIGYMVDHSPMVRGQVEGEIDRYIGDPGQALSYMIGRLEIDRIRAETEERMGDRFDIKAFHDLVLGTGSVPLSTLRRSVEAF